MANYRALILCGVILLTRIAGSETAILNPVQAEDGPFHRVNIDGTEYYQVLDWAGERAPYLYFDVAPNFPRTGDPLYLTLRFRDIGFGELNVQYDSDTDLAATDLQQRYWSTEEKYQYRCFDQGTDRIAYFKIAEPYLRGRQNGGADLRLEGFFNGGRLTVESLTLSTEPPEKFEELAATPWLDLYEGTSRDTIDATTLDGKILCGYQGWFNVPGDGSNIGFRHWGCARERVTADSLTIDLWPDVSEYPDGTTVPLSELRFEDGTPARLYSAFRQETVLLHFRWMEQYGIDGVFLSRFVGETFDREVYRHINQVLANVRAGAHIYGRTWAMMIDVSMGSNPQVDAVLDDWKFLVDECRIIEDSRYLHHNGDPVVLLWGLGFQDRFWTPEEARTIIDFFQDDPDYGGVYLIGGAPSYWRTLGGVSETDPEWADIYRSYDAISPWAAGRFWDQQTTENYSSAVWQPDIQELEQLGLGYMPTAFPGFSWDNLQGFPPGTSLIRRDEGRFLWRQFYEQQRLGVRTTFVGMFDEVDEGTAIYKVTNNPPTGVYMQTYEGLPSDYYLKLTGAASEMMRGEIDLTPDIPDLSGYPRQVQTDTWKME